MKPALDPTDIIVAPPSLIDERFSETVILLINHVEDLGSIGLCMNRPLFVSVSDILDEEYLLDNLDDEVYWGGPSQEETVWILHTSDWGIDNTIDITDEWSITSHEDMFQFLSEDNRPEKMRIFMGYCSWEAGQLHAELSGKEPFRKKDSWLTIHNKAPEEVLEANLEDMWEQACEIACAQAVDNIL